MKITLSYAYAVFASSKLYINKLLPRASYLHLV